jgi:hypothetical protein
MVARLLFSITRNEILKKEKSEYEKNNNIGNNRSIVY